MAVSQTAVDFRIGVEVRPSFGRDRPPGGLTSDSFLRSWPMRSCSGRCRLD
jgi:hypothetical protein